MIYLQSLTKDELAALLLPHSKARKTKKRTDTQIKDYLFRQARYRAKQLFTWFYVRKVSDWNAMTDLSNDLRHWLAENMKICQPVIRDEKRSSDGTCKFLWVLEDGKTVESVVIPSKDEDDETQRLTLCISSQVGCAMGCKFCMTASQGFERNLETHEIIAQVHESAKRFPITNIVFMGMGEPLNNVDNVIKACRILIDQEGMAFSKRKVTVSTAGILPAMNKFGTSVDVSLAVSLNATTDEQRSVIMPVNRKWDIAALMEACSVYPLKPHRWITFEYVLIRDFNDSLEDAARLCKLIKGIKSKINLIPFNEHCAADFKSPSEDRVRQFHKYLVDQHVTAIVRHSRGADVSAACGQLKSARLSS